MCPSAAPHTRGTTHLARALGFAVNDENGATTARGWSVGQGFTPDAPITLELGAYQPDRRLRLARQQASGERRFSAIAESPRLAFTPVYGAV